MDFSQSCRLNVQSDVGRLTSQRKSFEEPAARVTERKRSNLICNYLVSVRHYEQKCRRLVGCHLYWLFWPVVVAATLVNACWFKRNPLKAFWFCPRDSFSTMACCSGIDSRKRITTCSMLKYTNRSLTEALMPECSPVWDQMRLRWINTWSLLQPSVCGFWLETLWAFYSSNMIFIVKCCAFDLSC